MAKSQTKRMRHVSTLVVHALTSELHIPKFTIKVYEKYAKAKQNPENGIYSVEVFRKGHGKIASQDDMSWQDIYDSCDYIYEQWATLKSDFIRDMNLEQFFPRHEEQRYMKMKKQMEETGKTFRERHGMRNYIYKQQIHRIA